MKLKSRKFYTKQCFHVLLLNAETIKIKSKFSLICNLFSECKPMQVDLSCVELINFVMYAFKSLVTLLETTLF